MCIVVSLVKPIVPTYLWKVLRSSEDNFAPILMVGNIAWLIIMKWVIWQNLVYDVSYDIVTKMKDCPRLCFVSSPIKR